LLYRAIDYGSGSYIHWATTTTGQQKKKKKKKIKNIKLFAGAIYRSSSYILVSQAKSAKELLIISPSFDLAI
jgi:hypothetical protein